MAWKRHTASEIIGQLPIMEFELGKGLAAGDTCRKLDITR